MTDERVTLGSLRARYAAGAPVSSVVGEALDRLDAARSPSVLIGGPLTDAALAAAERLDGVDPSSLPLFGVPFVVKDNIDVAGAPTTAGCPSFGYLPERDATVVGLLRAAGAIVVGKGNLDQFATGLVGTRSPYGTPRNTLDPALVPGGSSSGSAVAVASGAVAFALGTDTAGSGRVPAAFNRIVGLKATCGAVSTSGVIPAVRRIDCVSVFAGSVADAVAVAAVAGRYDPTDPYSRERPRSVVHRPVRRVGVPAGWADDAVLCAPALAAFTTDLEAMAAVGVVVEEIDATLLYEAGQLLYGGPLVAERFAAVGHVFDGRPDLDPTVAAIITGATGWSAVEAYRAEYRLAELQRAAGALWGWVDAIAMPAVPFAPTLAQVAADPIGVNARLGRFTTFVNLLDLAAVVVPSRADGPYGLQLVGPAWTDDALVGLAAAVAGEPEPPSVSGVIGMVVVGAHLRGQPLNHQLVDAGAHFISATRTASSYRLHALQGTVPPKPGLERVPSGGASVEVELWEMPLPSVGTFLAGIPAPLCLGSVELEDGSWHHGFLCEPHALATSHDITHHGGWRAYLAAR